MKKIYLFLVLILFCILIFSCVLTSKKPLSDYKTSKVDEKLIGKWKIIDEENKQNPGYMMVLRGKDNHLLFIMFNQNYMIDDGYQGFVSEVGNEKYINLNPLLIQDGKHQLYEEEEYIFLHYKYQKKRLIVTIFNKDFFEEAIKNGELKGEIVKSKKSMDPGSVKLTDSTENIVNYLKEKDVSKYTNTEAPFIFEKISKLPSPAPMKK